MGLLKEGTNIHMKSSTLHRSTLSRERMSMVQNVKPQIYGNIQPDLNQYIKIQKKPELDVLWRDFEKSVQSKSRAKAPIVYAGLGFVLGLIFAGCIFAIVGISMYSDVQKVEKGEIAAPQVKQEAPVSFIPSGTTETKTQNSLTSEEKYTIQEGDTLDKVAFRFYGQYDQEKIDMIMKLNNIKDPTRIQIGQVLIIPLN